MASSGSGSRRCINQGCNNGNKNANGRPKQTVAWMWPPRGGIIQWLHLPGRAVQHGTTRRGEGGDEGGSSELNLESEAALSNTISSRSLSK